ncbi:glutathione S-transferase family protein [Pseudochrobactrum sp. HB0163]|uniref:glutathione S-transferase family protein n=1 Tax=Pseudochrobactrum sp. HB0163 TaxID=3450708 RepID=UPI003F6DACA4
MHKLYTSPASPFSAKVRMAAVYAGIELEKHMVVTSDEPAELIAANPLGKIPTVITPEGKAVFDSRVITQYFNRLSANKLFPRNAEKRLDAEKYEALADGLADALVAHVYERTKRPQEIIYQPILDWHWKKAERALDLLNETAPRLGAKIHCGHIAIAAVLGYLNIRFGNDWERGRPKLKRWFKRFAELHPALAAQLPRPA